LFFIENRNIHIYSDDYALNQIFSNLIDNAIKFTEQGKVVVEFSEQENFYNIEVKDTGIGISEEYIPHLFTPFSQEERGYTRRYEGNGLGLALAKQYCNFNNIHFSYSPKKDLGTTFIVSIPKVVI
jgi:signal transduction histidine kinase